MRHEPEYPAVSFARGLRFFEGVVFGIGAGFCRALLFRNSLSFVGGSRRMAFLYHSKEGQKMTTYQKRTVKAAIVVSTVALLSLPVNAMHIAEGFLPVGWCITWGVVFLPFLVYGMFSIKNKCADNSRVKLLLAMAGAYCFVLSALKLPSVTGSSSHPTGTGLGAILFGPAAMAVIGLIVLLFQALLLAHGGLTTLGANAFSMAVAGPFAGYAIYLIAKKCKAPMWLSVFLCAFTADLFTYAVTSTQLAAAFYNESVPFASALGQFMTVFAVTQIPLAIMEGILTVLVYRAISALCADELKLLAVTA